MKILMISGSPHENGCTDAALREMERVFHEAGVETDLLRIGGVEIRDCTDCGACGKTGRCVFDDAVNTAIEKMADADGLVLASPVHYAGISGAMKSFLDRLFYVTGGFPDKPCACLASARRAGTTTAIDALLKYPMISNMPVVSSQYWPMVHGNCAEEVGRDREGTQIMRQLARNMVWLLRCIQAGAAAGVQPPEHEARAWTNFIE